MSSKVEVLDMVVRQKVLEPVIICNCKRPRPKIYLAANGKPYKVVCLNKKCGRSII